MTYRLDANLLPWLTPGSKDARQSVHNAAVLRAYAPLYGSSNRPRQQPPCPHQQLEYPPTRPFSTPSRARSAGPRAPNVRYGTASPSSGYGSWVGLNSRGTSSDRLNYTPSPTDIWSAGSERHPSPAPAITKPISQHGVQFAEQEARRSIDDQYQTRTEREFQSATDGHSRRANHTSRPQSSSGVRLERRHRSQMRRPASAAPMMQSGDYNKGVSVSGQGYGSDRPQVLLKIVSFGMPCFNFKVAADTSEQ